MLTDERIRRFLISVGMLLVLLGVSSGHAQETPTSPLQQPVTRAQRPGPTPVSESKSQSANPSATPETEPVYGFQGVLVETLDGREVTSQSADEKFNPASAVKLATALAALRTFGPEYRFTTGVWTNGTLDRATGTVTGDLFISGRDPSFHYEHAVMLARLLNGLGIRQVNGDLIVAPGFTMNFNWSTRRSGENLFDTLDSTLRPGAAIRAWMDERIALGDKASLQTVPSLAVMGAVYVSPVAVGARLLVTHKSSKLVDLLKVLLCYSNNFMAERLGDTLGGAQSVRQQIAMSLGIAPGELMLSSLSGLGVNRVTPRAMMKVYRALRDELRRNRLSCSDILPVAGIDPGTLQDRFTSLPWRGSVIAKTGTLVRTDGGASSLVGQMRTADGATLLFVIFNQRGSVIRFRENQDYLVMQIQSSRGGPAAFDYKPLKLAMRLADTENSSASGDEYEPALKKTSNRP